MRVLRAIVKAVLALHRWFMKYSGMTMIIDNVEERRHGRQNQDHPDEDSGSSCEGGSPSQKRKTESATRTAVDERWGAGVN